ncbi:MAG: hypothetical protein KR126chlam2_00299 [Chlamydiae bacterium]|nr:hypothetical protein [Chlamydiota bacterium]
MDQLLKSDKEDLELAERYGVSVISYQDPRYPKKLLTLRNFPPLLYVKGEISPEDEVAIGVIGTRNATLYGKEMAERVGGELAERGICVVSGLARGIDTAAHRGALRTGRTIAVIGSGLANIYPRENQGLAEEIGANGAVISEFPMAMPPLRQNFPRRNRLISGLAMGLCLVESPLKGGGMITMEMGKRQGKKLFAFPGRVDWPTFEGNHRLIKEEKAKLVENGKEIAAAFSLDQNIFRPSFKVFLTEEEKKFLALLPPEEKSIEELALLTQLPAMKLNVLLTRMVLKKTMKEFPGKIYKKNLI